MVSYVRLAFRSWLTPMYLALLGVIIAGAIANITRERKLRAQIVGGMVLIPLLLRFLLIK